MSDLPEDIPIEGDVEVNEESDDVVMDLPNPLDTGDDTKDNSGDTKDTAEQEEGQKLDSASKHGVMGKTETVTGGEAIGIGARKKITGK